MGEAGVGAAASGTGVAVGVGRTSVLAAHGTSLGSLGSLDLLQRAELGEQRVERELALPYRHVGVGTCRHRGGHGIRAYKG